MFVVKKNLENTGKYFYISFYHFVHFCVHNLNLVICDAAKSTQVASNFFSTIQTVFNIFSSDSPRWVELTSSDETAITIRLNVLKIIDLLADRSNIHQYLHYRKGILEFSNL